MTGPLGNTFKVDSFIKTLKKYIQVTFNRSGDKCTASLANEKGDVSITMEIVGGKFVETYTGKGNTFVRTSSK